MKQIKFRAWNTDYSTPSMEYFDLQKGMKPLNYNPLYKFQDKVLMQFTGLLDKNGKEIYEGDIVKFIDPNSFPEPFTEFTTEVFWCNRFSRFSLKNTHTDLSFLLDDIEVIGNIHENPALLKVQ